MSEVRGNDQEFFRALEALQMDPYISGIINEVREYNKQLADEPLTEQEVLSIRKEIDDKWTHLFNDQVIFSGKISKITDGAIQEAKYYEDVEYTFKGVEAIGEDDHDVDIDDDDFSRIYQLNIFMTKTRKTGDVEKYLAKIDDIASLEFPDRMSAERAGYILQNYHPEILKDIDSALDDPSSDESMTAMRLEGLQYDTTDHDEDTAERVVMALGLYVNSKIMFDKNIGYVVTIDGEVWTDKSDRSTLDGYSAPTTIDRIEWRPSPKNGEIVPHFKLQNRGKHLSDAAMSMHVPMESISSIYSLRHKFWQDHPKNPSD